MTLTKNIFTYVFLLFAISLQAQPDDLPSEEVKVIKDFEANLEETDKINLNPTMPVVDTTSQRLMYAVPNRNLNVNYLPPKIRPIAIKANPIEKAYNGYAKLGYGTPNSPFAAAAYHFIDPAKYNIGLQVKHHSANNKDLEHQRFMENFAQVDAIYHLSQGLAAEADLSFFNDVVHFYGYDHAVESFTKDQVRQRFNTLNFAGKIYNGQQIESDFNYEVGFDAYTISDNFASRENAFLLHLGASKWFAEQHLLNVKVKADFTSFKDDATFNNNIFSMLPKFTMHGDRFKFGLGANVVLNEKEFTVFPDVDAAFNILGKKLTAFAGWKGNLEKNTFRSLTDYNPFLVSDPSFQNSKISQYYGGLSGQVQFVNYEIQMGNKSIDGLPLYLNNTTDSRRFDVLYDTAKVFYVTGIVGFELTKDLNLNVSVTFNNFDLKDEQRPWHLPTTETNIAATYKTLKNKLRLKAECYVSDAVYYKNSLDEAVKLNSLLDLSLGAEYFFTKQIGVFADVNNFASNRRVRWRNYPNYGVNLYGGITAKF